MSTMNQVARIEWRIHFHSNVSTVFAYLNSDEGRKKFWAEEAVESGNQIHFRFINGIEYSGNIVRRESDMIFELNYFNTNVRFELQSDRKNGTDLRLVNENIPEEEYQDFHSGWVSVLLAMKAAVDFNIDIRNHDPLRSWDQHYADN